MTVPRYGLILIIFCLLASWMSGLARSSFAAQTTQEPIQKFLGKESKGGVWLRTSSETAPILAPLLNTTVNMTISGLIARTTVSQQFSNPSEEWAEGVYVFPLPEQAAVDHLRMKIGERIIEGQIQERTQAKRTYAQAKAKGQHASLVEQERPNIFTTSVANIAPHAPITITIEYQEMVRYNQGRFSLRFPMVVGPRYIPGQSQDSQNSFSNPHRPGWARNTNQVSDASRITPPVHHPSKGLLNPITLQIDLAPGILLQNISSPTHPITITKHATNAYNVSLQNISTFAGRDFALIWTPLSKATPQTSVFMEQFEDETYLFLQLVPPTITSRATSSIPREVIFVIDTSGSMGGQSLSQAKAALTLAVSRLKSHDSFNIIQFNSRSHSLYANAKPASSSRIHDAQRYVNGLQAEGGTELRAALELALTHPPRQDAPHRLRQIVFLTDGLVGNEEAIFALLQRDLQQSRLFTIGIGSAPNSYFMRKAAQFGKGSFTHIGSTTEVQDTMNRLFRKLEQPALTDISIHSGDSPFLDILPNPIPDLYHGEPLTLAVRSTNLPSSITITGKLASRPWETVQSLFDAKPRSGVAVHWARQKISQLMDGDIQQNDTPHLKQAIVDLALKHHVVSHHTSLVAIDVTPMRPEAQALHPHVLKTNLPYGMQYESIFGWPQTATPAALYLLLGSLILGVTWIWSRHYLAHR